MQLTPDQRLRMVEGRDRFIETIKTIGDNHRGSSAATHRRHCCGPLDRSAIDAKVGGIHAQQQAMQRTVVEHLIADKSIYVGPRRAVFRSRAADRAKHAGAAVMPRESRTP